jgi:hypothetical protein
VRAEPFDEFTIARHGAESVAEPGRQHRVDLRRCPVHVVVDHGRGEDIGLQHDRPVPAFDEVTKEFVAQQRKRQLDTYLNVKEVQAGGG